ncbi:hypothetical protein PENTCL1PPCAC_9525 [Pristionchus entomophagus]|uniref:MIT domain-containing protein n=1 Tax=Pristionchus entomophagus TaxID=358040 RepID=A0AAV5SW46_9BILA|nr:hypothetical protein PENTCL1PPCAC_9525 [Pristionchus entomophagus]
MTQVAGPSYVQQGVALVTRAVEEDTARNYEEALELYDRSIECFFHAMKSKVEVSLICTLLSPRKHIIRAETLVQLPKYDLPLNHAY